mmetsp:Transcript_31398/g.72833  ORF Transcript_31398/g.72833 Transcript_31398/m.72833 type:complete len:273 (-) Transcript_31398:430-1248(-)
MEADPQTRKGNGIPTPVPSSVGEGGTVSAGDALVEPRVNNEHLGHVHARRGCLDGGLDLLDRLGVLGAVQEILGRLQSQHVIDACKEAHRRLCNLARALMVVTLHHDLTELQHGPGLLTCIPRAAEEVDAFLACLHSLKVEATLQEHIHHCLQHRSLALHITRLREKVAGLVHAGRRLLYVAGLLLHKGDAVHASGLLGLVAELLVKCHGLLHLLGCEEALRRHLGQVRALDCAVNHSHGTLLAKLGKDGQRFLGHLDGWRRLLAGLVDTGQ